jgi:hypothetical protein
LPNNWTMMNFWARRGVLGQPPLLALFVTQERGLITDLQQSSGIIGPKLTLPPKCPIIDGIQTPL